MCYTISEASSVILGTLFTFFLDFKLLSAVFLPAVPVRAPTIVPVTAPFVAFVVKLMFVVAPPGPTGSLAGYIFFRLYRATLSGGLTLLLFAVWGMFGRGGGKVVGVKIVAFNGSRPYTY